MTEISLNEALSLIKQKESEIFRLTQLKESIFGETLPEAKYLGKGDEYTPEEYNEALEDFIVDKKQQIKELEEEITGLIDFVRTVRQRIQEANHETGQYKNLIEMKWVRIRLNNLMKLLNGSSYGLGRGLGRGKTESDKYKKFGLGEKISELEERRNKLDSEIQSINHETKIEIPVIADP